MVSLRRFFWGRDVQLLSLTFVKAPFKNFFLRFDDDLKRYRRERTGAMLLSGLVASRANFFLARPWDIALTDIEIGHLQYQKFFLNDRILGAFPRLSMADYNLETMPAINV